MQYEDLDRLIDSLATEVASDDPRKGYWRELWGLVSNIRAKMKETQYPTAEDKNNAIRRLTELVEAAKRRSEEVKRRSEEVKRRREERQRDWEKRATQSDRARHDIESKVASTRPTTDLERTIASVIIAPLMMLEAALRAALGLEQLDIIHNDLKVCSSNMKDAWSLFNESKRDLLPGDKSELYKQLSEAQERLNLAWDQWKRTKNEAYEERRRAWETRQLEREEKHRNFVARVEANIEKLEAKISKAQDTLERQRYHLSDLYDKQRDAWNDDFREKCSDWIGEAEEKIRSIENSIEQWREWLEQEHDKLRR